MDHMWLAPALLFGLAPSGVYHAVVVTNTAVRSYHTISPLPEHIYARRYLFCCTFHGLASSRRYLALCPVEPGLSSIATATATASINSQQHSTTNADNIATLDDNTHWPDHKVSSWVVKTGCAPAPPLPYDSSMDIRNRITCAFY